MVPESFAPSAAGSRTTVTSSFQRCLATVVRVPESVDGEVLLLRRPVTGSDLSHSGYERHIQL